MYFRLSLFTSALCSAEETASPLNALQTGHGAAGAPHPQARWLSSQGNSGWSSQTQRQSSQRRQSGRNIRIAFQTLQQSVSYENDRVCRRAAVERSVSCCADLMLRADSQLVVQGRRIGGSSEAVGRIRPYRKYKNLIKTAPASVPIDEKDRSPVRCVRAAKTWRRSSERYYRVPRLA